MTQLDLSPSAVRLATLIGSIPEDRLKLPTPCTEARLGDLVEHVRGCTIAFRNAARKGGGEIADQGAALDMSQLPDDWCTSIPAAVLDLAGAWSADDAWTGMTRAGGIDAPGEVFGVIALDEIVLHGWDIARSLGVAYEPDATVVPVLVDFVEHAPPGLFKPPVPVPDDAPLFDQLLGRAGRDPNWSPPS
jgi:uncharacterized protein (TIGR03086 family)